MKKWMSVFLTLSLLLALAACGAAAQTAAPAAETASSAVEQPAPAVPAETAESGALHHIALVNATVAGEDHMELAQEGTFLARAVLPDRSVSVDYWTIDGTRADAGGRRYSLEFDSSGADVVSAVLRDKLHVSCEGCYLQFLDDNGTAGGPMYQKVYFEDNYAIPITGNEHPGGTINCHVAAKIPAGMKVDYWVINGTAVRFDSTVTGFQLIGLAKSLEIEVVYTSGSGTPGSDLIMKFDPLPPSDPHLPDDEPVILDDTGMDDWVMDPDQIPDTTTPAPPATSGEHVHEWIFDPEHSYPATSTESGRNTYKCSGCSETYYQELPAQGTGEEHVHDWVFDAEHSYPPSCTESGRNTFKCSGCGETYSQVLPGGHSYQWVSDGIIRGSNWDGGTHTQVCSVCGARGATENHVLVEDWSISTCYCTVCGDSYHLVIN